MGERENPNSIPERGKTFQVLYLEFLLRRFLPPEGLEEPEASWEKISISPPKPLTVLTDFGVIPPSLFLIFLPMTPQRPHKRGNKEQKEGGKHQNQP